MSGLKRSGMDGWALALVAGQTLGLGGPWPFLCEEFIVLAVKCFLKCTICLIPSGQVEVSYPKS